MSLTIFLAAQALRATDAAGVSRPAVTMVARATIVSGVRIAQTVATVTNAMPVVIPPAREVACPADSGTGCRLITIDMP